MTEAMEISFNDALAHLQPLLGRKVSALVNVRDTFSGCVMEGKLERVLTLPPDNATVHVIIGDRHGIILDPEDVDALLVKDRSSDEECLEFRLPSGVVIRLESA